MNKNKQQDLTNNNLFSGFTPSELAKISENSHYQTLEKNQYCFQEGQEATDFFLNIYGQIKVAFLSAQGDEKIIDVINEGQSFAEAIIFLGDKNYPVNATALMPSKVLRIDAQCYFEILEKSPKACFKIMGKLSQRLHWAVNEINSLTLHDSTYRLVRFLLNNAQQENGLLSTHLSVSKQILASQLAIQPETLSRTLKTLSKQGFIEVNNDCVVLLKLAELEDIVA